MTTAELAVIQAPAAQQLTEKEAKALDKKIRTASDKLSTSTETLLNLLEQAAAGSIHEALGLGSWTAWFKDAVQISISDKFERKELVKMMSGKGMSQRAIAGSLGVSQKTVDRDLEGEEVEEGATVTSLDGAQRPKAKAKAVEPEEDYIEAEVVPDEEQTDAADDPPTPAVELVEQFNDETANLWAAVAELEEIAGQEKWPNAKNRIVKANLEHLDQCITKLTALRADLVGEEQE